MTKLVEEILEKLQSDSFTDTTILHLVPGSADRRYGLVKRALKAKELLHLRRGLYVLSDKYRRGPLNLFELAQKIYGPSYISFESALSYHGWIPETVYTMTSASLKRSREFHTPLGTFSFSYIPSSKFFVGVERKVSEGVFFMASPWKALADYVYYHKKNWKSLKPAIESLRLDESQLQDVDFRLLEQIYESTRSAYVKSFLDGVKKEFI